jgi:hypothetical protein
MPPRPPHERHVPSSAISGFIDESRIEALLTPWVPDPHARAFVVRCMLAEGPAHHRGANYVLLHLLGLVLERLPGKAAPSAPEGEAESIAVPMRLPPHLETTADEHSYPLRLPTAPLERIAPRGTQSFEAIVDCLTDGPPQHALANVAMVALISELLARLEDGGR